ncbi:class I SAM-dependent methyltransferase [Streptomyces sp. CA-250714]|uniref:class I SAM-dependent methyltransferase n=1 Tax=Streptomyces sp. CA-250714 TaxID=3240060 RepID=UPI003D939810
MPLGADRRGSVGLGDGAGRSDFSPVGLELLREAAEAQAVARRVTTAVHDVREPLPLSATSVDAVFAHMLLCMTLSTEEIHALVAEGWTLEEVDAFEEGGLPRRLWRVAQTLPG